MTRDKDGEQRPIRSRHPTPDTRHFSQGVMSAADGLPRKEEDGSAILSTLTISGRQADTSWLHLSRKQDRLKPRSEHYRRLPPTLNPQRKESYETCHPLPKPVALSKELQTTSSHPNPTGHEAELHFSADATVWFKTATETRLVAQEQSARLISGRPRSVTARDDHLRFPKQAE